MMASQESRPGVLPTIVLETADAALWDDIATRLQALGHPVSRNADPLRPESPFVRIIDEPTDGNVAQFQNSILLTSSASPTLTELALQHGAAALLVKPLETAHIQASIRIAIHRAIDLQSLRDRIENLVGHLTSDQSVSMAVGVLVERYQLPPTDAYERLRRYARNRRVRAHDVADEVVRNLASGNSLLKQIMATPVESKA